MHSLTEFMGILIIDLPLPRRYHIFPMTDANTTSTEVDSPNHSGNPYNGCLSLDVRLTDF